MTHEHHLSLFCRLDIHLLGHLPQTPSSPSAPSEVLNEIVLGKEENKSDTNCQGL